MKLSNSSFRVAFGSLLILQLITTFSRYPSLSNIELIFLVVLPPYPDRYPPKTRLDGFFDLPIYKISEAGFPVSVLSAKIKTLLLSCGRAAKERPFNGTNSAKPLSLSVKEFIIFTNRAQNLTFAIYTILSYIFYFRSP